MHAETPRKRRKRPERFDGTRLSFHRDGRGTYAVYAFGHVEPYVTTLTPKQLDAICRWWRGDAR